MRYAIFRTKTKLLTFFLSLVMTFSASAQEVPESCDRMSEKVLVAPIGSSSPWAGRVLEMCVAKIPEKLANRFRELLDKNPNDPTVNGWLNNNKFVKIQIEWRIPESQYNCGQMIIMNLNEVKEFTHHSLKIKKCK